MPHCCSDFPKAKSEEPQLCSSCGAEIFKLSFADVFELDKAYAIISHKDFDSLGDEELLVYIAHRLSKKDRSPRSYSGKFFKSFIRQAEAEMENPEKAREKWRARAWRKPAPDPLWIDKLNAEWKHHVRAARGELAGDVPLEAMDSLEAISFKSFSHYAHSNLAHKRRVELYQMVFELRGESFLAHLMIDLPDFAGWFELRFEDGILASLTGIAPRTEEFSLVQDRLFGDFRFERRIREQTDSDLPFFEQWKKGAFNPANA